MYYCVEAARYLTSVSEVVMFSSQCDLDRGVGHPSLTFSAAGLPKRVTAGAASFIETMRRLVLDRLEGSLRANTHPAFQ
jgi:hypothetical protein